MANQITIPQNNITNITVELLMNIYAKQSAIVNMIIDMRKKAGETEEDIIKAFDEDVDMELKLLSKNIETNYGFKDNG